MEIKKWSGEVEQTFYLDLIYPKGGAKGSIRLVLRNPAGRVIENILDFKADGSIRLMKISEDNRKYFPLNGDGFLAISCEDGSKMENVSDEELPVDNLAEKVKTDLRAPDEEEVVGTGASTTSEGEVASVEGNDVYGTEDRARSLANL